MATVFFCDITLFCPLYKERDTQWTHKARELGAFYNTWSVDGFMSEARQPAEVSQVSLAVLE
jgi:homospermidine synthase